MQRYIVSFKTFVPFTTNLNKITKKDQHIHV